MITNASAAKAARAGDSDDSSVVQSRAGLVARLLLSLALLISAIWRALPEPGADPSGLAFWAVSGASMSTSAILARVVAATEAGLAVGLLPRRSWAWTLLAILVWNLLVTLVSFGRPGFGLDALLLGSAPARSTSQPGATFALAWFLYFLAWMVSTTKPLRDRGNPDAARTGASLALWIVPVLQDLPVQPAHDRSALNLIAFEHANASTDDVSDLSGLEGVLANRDVVLLGEVHRDGSAYASKTRLVKFLHERLGFDVLAFESSLLECSALQARLANLEDSSEVASSPGIDFLWADSPYMRPLFDYVLRTQRTSRPLMLIGLDCKFTPPGVRSFPVHASAGLPSDLGGFLRASIGNGLVEQPDVELEITLLERFVRDVFDGQFDPDPRSRSSLEHAVEVLEGCAELPSGRSRQELEFRAQVLRALRAFMEWSFATNGSDSVALALNGSFTNARDAFMADTIDWSMKHLRPGARFMVWTGGFHGLVDPCAVHTLDEEGSSGPFDAMRTMAGLLRERLGQRCFVVGTTSVRGWMGGTANPHQLTPPATASIEHVLEECGAPCGFLDVHGSLPPLESSVISRLYLGVDARVDLPRCVDGLLFSRNAYGERPWTMEQSLARQSSRQPCLASESCISLKDVHLLIEQCGDAVLSASGRSAMLELASQGSELPIGSWREPDCGDAMPLRDPASPWVHLTVSPVVPRFELDPVCVLAERGLARESSYTFLAPSVLASSDSLDGEVIFAADGAAIVRGNVTSRVAGKRGLLLVSSGALSGSLELLDRAFVRFKDGLQPGARITCRAPGATLELGGFTAAADLDVIAGSCVVRLERSDLLVGSHQRGGLHVLVGSGTDKR